MPARRRCDPRLLPWPAGVAQPRGPDRQVQVYTWRQLALERLAVPDIPPQSISKTADRASQGVLPPPKRPKPHLHVCDRAQQVQGRSQHLL